MKGLDNQIYITTETYSMHNPLSLSSLLTYNIFILFLKGNKFDCIQHAVIDMRLLLLFIKKKKKTFHLLLNKIHSFCFASFVFREGIVNGV